MHLLLPTSIILLRRQLLTLVVFIVAQVLRPPRYLTTSQTALMLKLRVFDFSVLSAAAAHAMTDSLADSQYVFRRLRRRRPRFRCCLYSRLADNAPPPPRTVFNALS
jgi:hypothetical protein